MRGGTLAGAGWFAALHAYALLSADQTLFVLLSSWLASLLALVSILLLPHTIIILVLSTERLDGGSGDKERLDGGSGEKEEGEIRPCILVLPKSC